MDKSRGCSASCVYTSLIIWQTAQMGEYDGCFKSNASCFIVLAHNIRGRCWWYGSRSWTFPINIPLYCVAEWQIAAEGVVWPNGVRHGSVYEAKMYCWVPPCKRNGTHWHSSMLAECLWRPKHDSEVVGGAFQQWQQQQWGTSTGADVYKHGIQALVHCW